MDGLTAWKLVVELIAYRKVSFVTKVTEMESVIRLVG
jgi:hypothetical protein